MSLVIISCTVASLSRLDLDSRQNIQNKSKEKISRRRERGETVI